MFADLAVMVLYSFGAPQSLVRQYIQWNVPSLCIHHNQVSYLCNLLLCSARQFMKRPSVFHHLGSLLFVAIVHWHLLHSRRNCQLCELNPKLCCGVCHLIK